MRAAILVGLVLMAGRANAYSVILDNGDEPIKWGTNTVTWYLVAGSTDLGQADLEATLVDSFTSWQGVSCSAITFTYGGKKTNPPTGIAIAWEESNWDLSTGDALAVTHNWQIGGSGATRVEITFNGVDYTWTTGPGDSFGSLENIEETAAHEIGHAIGLDHSRDPQATMWFTSNPSADATTLAEDDRRGACFLYPNQTFDDGLACDACTSSANCANGLCLNLGSGEGPYCGQECLGAADCPTGMVCFSVTGAPETDPGQCFPESQHCAPVGGNIPLGDFCYGHGTCETGQCLTTDDSAVCTTDCTVGGASNGGCPATMSCLASGGSGICYPKGAGQLGDACLGSFDCAEFDCIGVGDGKGVCTKTCSNDAGCPSDFRCLTDACIPRGDVPFGGKCTDDTMCQTAICRALRCTDLCEQDVDCPGESTCGDGFCLPGPTGELHAACGETAEVCKSAYFCLIETNQSVTGSCEVKCDTRTDECPAGELCRRVYQSWVDKVVGVCTSDVLGGTPGDSCGNAEPCQAGLVCADLGTGNRCWRDCNAKNLLGCGSNELCVAVGGAVDPKLGACKPAPGSDGVDASDAADGQDGVDATDGIDASDGADGRDGADAADGSDADGADATEGTDGPGTDSSATDSTGADSADGADTTDSDGSDGQSDGGGRRGRSACSAAASGAIEAPLLALFLLFLLALRNTLGLGRPRRSDRPN